MKDLKECLTESLNESAKDLLLKRLQKDWDSTNSNHNIPISEIIEFSKQALKSAKVTARSIQDEISKYKDPDDLIDAMASGELTDTNNFIDEFSHVLSISDKYEGEEDDYTDCMADPWLLYNLMGYIDRFEK